MTELKLSEIKGLLPDKKEESPYSSNPEICFENPGYNRAIDDLSTKNLLDYVEAVVCPNHYCDRGLIRTQTCCNVPHQYDGGDVECCGAPDITEELCKNCLGTGAVIRVKEGK